MITDPASILKVKGAMTKLQDAKEKLCDCVASPAIPIADLKTIQEEVDRIGVITMRLSVIIPADEF